jgi:hypothetical protein
MNHTLANTGTNAEAGTTHVVVEKDIRVELAFKALKIVSKAIVAIILAGSDHRSVASLTAANQPQPRLEIHAPVILIHDGSVGWPAKAVSVRCSER